MKEIARDQLIRRMFGELVRQCVQHEVMPGEVLCGNSRKGRGITEARRGFAWAMQRAFCQWGNTQKNLRFGALADGEAPPPGWRPLSTVQIGLFLGVDHSSVVYGKRPHTLKARRVAVALRDAGG